MLPKFLQLLASSQSKIVISDRACKKIAVLGMLANARKDHSSPLGLLTGFLIENEMRHLSKFGDSILDVIVLAFHLA